MKIRVLPAMAAMLMLAGCGSKSSGDMPAADEQVDIIETAQTEETAETQGEISEDEAVINEIKACVALGEYGRAAALTEENIRLTEKDSFREVFDDIMNHYRVMAKEYYTAANAYLIKAYLTSGDGEPIEGFDREKNSLDPAVLSHLLTDGARNTAARTDIYLVSEDMNDFRCRVTIRICGTEAVFDENTPLPKEDGGKEILPERLPAGESELAKQVSLHLDKYEFAKAAALMEENAAECQGAEFDGARTAILIHFTDIAKDYHSAAATYITKQEIQGYDFTTGFEGYNSSDKSIDPACLEDMLTAEDKTAVNRVRIVCTNDYTRELKVTAQVCGMTAVYPAEDIVLT